jgi:hypothetical protein
MLDKTTPLVSTAERSLRFVAPLGSLLAVIQGILGLLNFTLTSKASHSYETIKQSFSNRIRP